MPQYQVFSPNSINAGRSVEIGEYLNAKRDRRVLLGLLYMNWGVPAWSIIAMNSLGPDSLDLFKAFAPVILLFATCILSLKSATLMPKSDYDKKSGEGDPRDWAKDVYNRKGTISLPDRLADDSQGLIRVQ